MLGKEVPGFVANRLQAALFRECIHLVTSGVVDVAGLDRIVTSSIGLRWAAQGPFLSFDLGGGSGASPRSSSTWEPGSRRCGPTSAIRSSTTPRSRW